jgi:hypothetical protein
VVDNQEQMRALIEKENGSLVIASRTLSLLVALGPLVAGVACVGWAVWQDQMVKHPASPASLEGGLVEGVFAFLTGAVLIVLSVPYILAAVAIWRGRSYGAIMMIVLCAIQGTVQLFLLLRSAPHVHTLGILYTLVLIGSGTTAWLVLPTVRRR